MTTKSELHSLLDDARHEHRRVMSVLNDLDDAVAKLPDGIGTAAAAFMEENLKRLCEENDMLRAQLVGARDTDKCLRAQIAGMDAEYCDRIETDNRRLQSEIDRLTLALKEAQKPARMCGHGVILRTSALGCITSACTLPVSHPGECKVVPQSIPWSDYEWNPHLECYERRR